MNRIGHLCPRRLGGTASDPGSEYFDRVDDRVEANRMDDVEGVLSAWQFGLGTWPSHGSQPGHESVGVRNRGVRVVVAVEDEER